MHDLIPAEITVKICLSDSLMPLKEPLNSGAEMIDMIKLFLFLRNLRIHIDLLCWIWWIKDGFVSVQSVMRYDTVLTDISFPDSGKIFASRMPWSEILQEDMIRFIRSYAYCFLLMRDATEFFLTANHVVECCVCLVDLNFFSTQNRLLIGIPDKCKDHLTISHGCILVDHGRFGWFLDCGTKSNWISENSHFSLVQSSTIVDGREGTANCMSAFNTLVTSSVIALDEAVFAEMSMMTVGTFIRHDVIEDFQFFISSRVIFMSAVRRKTRIFFTHSDSSRSL